MQPLRPISIGPQGLTLSTNETHGEKHAYLNMVRDIGRATCASEHGALSTLLLFLIDGYLF